MQESPKEKSNQLSIQEDNSNLCKTAEKATRFFTASDLFCCFQISIWALAALAQKWITVRPVNLPTALNILQPFLVYVSPFFCSLSLLFFLVWFLCYSVWSVFFILTSGRRWPNLSLKQRRSIYMQIRRRYVYSLLKLPILACGAQEVKWVRPCFMHGDSATGEPLYYILNAEINKEGFDKNVCYP